MTTQDYVSLSLALKLNEHGYSKYSSNQYIVNDAKENKELHMSLE